MQRKLGDNNRYFTVFIPDYDYGIVCVYESGVPVEEAKYIETQISLGGLGRMPITHTSLFLYLIATAGLVNRDMEYTSLVEAEVWLWKIGMTPARLSPFMVIPAFSRTNRYIPDLPLRD